MTTWFLPFPLSLPDFPQNTQVSAHIKEFLKDGYRSSAEAVEVKFPHVDGSRTILDGTVGISDGFCKCLIMVGICVICHKLETWSCNKSVCFIAHCVFV